jgi:hypothetical protein
VQDEEEVDDPWTLRELNRSASRVIPKITSLSAPDSGGSRNGRPGDVIGAASIPIGNQTGSSVSGSGLEDLCGKCGRGTVRSSECGITEASSRQKEDWWDVVRRLLQVGEKEAGKESRRRVPGE